jgi:tetratricopeptide (TPR) repeat protein
MNLSKSSYRVYKPINWVIILGILAMLGGYYLLKPSDLRIACYYESQSSYKRAIFYYQQALRKARTNHDIRKKILKRLARLYRYTHQPILYIETVKKLSLLEEEPEYFKDALEVALNLWRKNKNDRQIQDNVLFFARILKREGFIKDFLVWNGRFKEALDLYEQDFKQGHLSAEKLKRAMQIALWTDEPSLKIKWLERGLKVYPHNTNIKKELLNLYLTQAQYQKAIAMLKPPKKAEDYYTLAYLYQKTGKYKEACEVYERAYHQFHKLSFLERAYFLARKYKLQKKALHYLVVLSDYKKDYALALAAIYQTKTSPPERLYLLNLYLHIYEKWHDLSALKASYSLAFALKLKDLQEKILWKLWERTKDKKYLSLLAKLYSNNKDKLALLWEKFSFLQADIKFMAYYYLQRKNYQKAEKYFLKLVEKFSSNKDYLEALAFIYMQEKKYKKAVSLYARLYALDISYREMYLHSALLAGESDYEKALQSVVEKEPMEEHFARLADFYLYVKKNDHKAAMILEKMLKKWPKDKYRLKLAYIYEKLKYPDKLIAILKQIPITEMSVHQVLFIAKVYTQQSRWHKAVSVLEKWLNVKSHLTERYLVLEYLSYLYKRLGNGKQFRKVNQQIVSLTEVGLQ